MYECPFVSGEEGGPQPRATPSKVKRRFSLRRSKVGGGNENAAPGTTALPGFGGGAAPPWLQSLEMTPKRKESYSSGVRRKSLRLVTLSFRQASGQKTKGGPSPPSDAPSVFERECLNNLSPNDPEFVRRTSMRWRRKTGLAAPPQGALFRVPPAHGCLLEVPLVSAYGAKFEWPTHPSQQPAVYKRVSVPQRPHDVPVALVPPSLPPHHRPFGAHASQRRDLLMRSQRRHSASGIAQRSLQSSPKPCGRDPAERLQKRSLQPSRGCPSFAGDRKGAPTCRKDVRRSSLRCGDDPITEGFLKLLKGDARHRKAYKGSKKSENLHKEKNLEVDHLLTMPTPLRRLSHRLRKSFGSHKRDCDVWSQSDLSSASDLSSTSSRSCHSYLSATLSSSSSCRSDLSFRSDLSSSSFSSSPSSVFSSSSSCHSDISTLSSSIRSSSSSPSRLGFHEIFVAETEVAETFAIMFPSEPRPEWHRHLRQVLHKAGQKIFKKPEHHDTHIPENLRYQLKQIYVY
ncbi:uncharacterized protein LOC125039145 [Penaeus chinensis]|uniref:uncharacterized protein LOC125039145 n=1 Tax=Penaeus chinensis TaxID=139456 RepID=UPI001FB7B7BF|nr:uncharacterized protein LOC125039145 [Penaeus chinensis]